MNTAVKISDLTVSLNNDVTALKNVNLELSSGQTIGIIGPSGAGKTTLINAIVGRLQVPVGSVLVFGVPAGSSELRTKVTYMSQELSIYTDLSVRDNLAYFATMMGQPKAQLRHILSEVMETVGLTDQAETLVDHLSGGQKQRVSLAIALFGSPELIVLDEPTVGLDPLLREHIWQVFTSLVSRGITVVISSHSMEEASRCDDLVLIRDGEIVAHSSPHEFLASTHTSSVEAGFLKLIGKNPS
jgi:ABC-2 type transport system ATP-binding protein